MSRAGENNARAAGTQLRQKWHLLYFVLAGLDLFAIGHSSFEIRFPKAEVKRDVA
jgi:hypothetical protein